MADPTEELYSRLFDEAEASIKAKAAKNSYTEMLKELTKTTREFEEALTKGETHLTEFYTRGNKIAIEYSSLASRLQKTNDILQKFNTSTPAAQMLYMGQALSNTGKSLTQLRDRIYNLQAKLGTTFSTAVDTGAGALMNMATSLFTAGPALSFQDTIDAFNAYQKEFGTLLTAGAARTIAQGAKQFGTDVNTFVRAQRAFLVGPNSVANQAKIQQSFVTQFRAAGLTANQALSFAANNANLVAIAGDKYADALARAAANAQRIGVGLDRTEALADGIVGNFEGALERFSELRAMGVEVDFNELARVAGTGTPEEVFNTLSQQLGGNQKLLSELQSNRFLKVALERDLGLNISEIRRLASGEGGLPAEATKEEKIENGIIAGIMKGLGPLLSGFGLLATAVGLNTLASYANTKALLINTGKSVGSLLTSGGLLKAAGGVGLGIAGIAGGSMLAYNAAQKKSTGGILGGIALSTLSGIGGGALVGGGIPGAVIGGILGLVSGIGSAVAASDIAMGPGKGRVILGPEGAFKLNAKDSILAGTNLMGSVGEGALNAREGYTIANLLKQTIGQRFFLGKNPLMANPYINAGADVGLSLMQGKGLQKSLVSGAGALAGGLGGQLAGAALGRMVGGAMGSVLGPVGTIAGGFLGAKVASALMAPKEPASGTLTTPQSAIAQQPATTTVNMNTAGIESKLDRLASAFSAMKIEMDGNAVGRVSLNARSPLDRLSVVG